MLCLYQIKENFNKKNIDLCSFYLFNKDLDSAQLL